ncbi:MAG: NAD-dependent epimerase/dehydratase family protein, partial [Phycisphaerales bacterium]|nr:NAD-dependent epimerase/dehydratase family protein [Phycisphaerales bacterium]
DAVIDFANDPDWKISWPTAIENIQSTYGGLLATQRAGVKRYVFTSSNHITGKYEREEPFASIARGEYAGLDPAKVKRITSSMPVRPDGHFGVAKAASEATARYFAEQFGMSNISLRLGTSLEGDQPRSVRQFHSLITKRDLLHLYECAIEAPLTLTFGAFFGVSNNTWRIWDISDTHDLIGFTPKDDTEAWRGKPFPTAPAAWRQA